ncbi:MAG: low specificity L-threonine aldolase [Spirochaetales bacterium]|nr:low specificity L-threonine aldolase [Spirochaetales bacterium]
MYSFKNDYSEGAHPEILKALTETNLIQAEGYGEDRFSIEAASLIREACAAPDIDIHFVAGGTMANLVALSSFLRPHEAVISTLAGHIYVHETGAIEATGHKVLPVDSPDGKIRPAQVTAVLEEHHFEHMVKPKLVYISQPTENGTLYSKGEMTALRGLCDEEDLFLYVDGARLGSALASEANDISLPDLKRLSDAFYIGGTKNGALLGEALVICTDSLKKDFRYMLKQKGAMMAKGRVTAIQFLSLFKEDLYVKLGFHANRMAGKLQDRIVQLGYDVQFSSSTNQIFPVFPESVIQALERKFDFYRWCKYDAERWVVRLICSWATMDEHVNAFVDELKRLG